MAGFLARRIAQGLIVVALVATIVFFLIHAAPGDPFSSSMEDPSISEALRENWRHAYGLDRPLGEQYARYVLSVLRGDLGFSTSKLRPVSHVLLEALPNTLLLMITGLVGGFALGIGIALAQVRNLGRRIDKMLGGLSLLFFSVPDFWLALLILVGLTSWLHVPIGGALSATDYGYMSTIERIADRLKHVILPALTLALLYFPIIARHQKAALLDVLPSDFVTTARAKGVAERAVINRHVLRNALLPTITLIGVAFPALLTGAVFVEKVFSWPGMGLVIVNSIRANDYQLVTGSMIFGSAFVVVGSILADVLYRHFDPRMRDEF